MNLTRLFVALCILSILVPVSAAGKSPGVVGAYVNFGYGYSDSPEEIRSLVKQAADAGIQFLIPNAKTTTGKAFYNSEILPRVRFGFDPLAILIDEAHKRGLEVHPWVCANAEGGASPTKFLQSRPDMCMVNLDGKRMGGLDPSSPEARAFIVSIVHEIARNYDIDGISLDYVRYLKPGHFCYCDRCKAMFKEATGLDTSEAYKAAPGTTLWRKWRLWRQSQFLIEMDEIRRVLKRIKPDATLGAFVVGAQGYESSSDLCEDWKTWIKRDLLDWVNTSGYTYDRSQFKARAAANVSEAPRNFPVFITLGVKTAHGKLDTREKIETQVRDAMEAGATGVVFFTLEYTKPLLKQISPMLHRLGRG